MRESSRSGFGRPFTKAAMAAALAIALGSLSGVPSGQSVTYEPVTATVVQSLTLELNIPAFRVDVREHSQVIRSFPVAVGMRRYKTPTGEFEIARIIWNPWWYPPDEEWAAKDTVTPPGPANPMGKVKLLLNGPYYLHGTPQVSSLRHAASHGCIRMRNADAVELAQIVQRNGGVNLSLEFMDSVTQSWKRTRTVNLTTFVPVSIVYRLAEVQDTMITVYPDVYRRGGTSQHVLQELALAGLDSSALDLDAIRKLAQRARTKAVSAPVRDLLSIIER